MKYLIFVLIIFSQLSCSFDSSKNRNNNHVSNINLTGSNELEKLVSGFIFTEGPAVDKEGNVYFTDIPQSLILKWSVDERLDTFRINSGGANGLFFNDSGNLIICEGGRGQVTSINPKGQYTVLADKYLGNRFNSPNDLWPDGKGGIYFTDPKYGEDEHVLDQDGMHVYYIKPNNTGIIRVADDFEKPNGIIGNPDGSRLFITDNKAGNTFNYNILKDGLLSDKKVFTSFGCDGMTTDTSGNIYLTTNSKNSVDIYSSSGEFLESISVSEKPSNVCFGGKNRNQLYITARTSLYRILLETKGVD